jgi:hypothetical protein
MSIDAYAAEHDEKRLGITEETAKRKRSLKDDLAGYMDPEAFRSSVPEPMKHIAPEMGKVVHDKLKVRREMATKRAGAAIRFFLKPENRERLDKLAVDPEA